MSIMDIFKQLEKEREAKSAVGKIEYIVAGLGNIGREYEGTRHNAGFMAIDAICEKCGVRVDTAKFHALVGDTTLGGKRVLLMKPTTFMNNSGEAVGEATRFYKIPPENVIIISDDISLAPGKLRVRRRGSHGGHNGLKSIEAHLSSNLYPRVKIGVGEKPHPDYDLADWVLGKFSAEDATLLRDATKKAVVAIELIVSGDIDGAMCKYN